MNTTPRGWYADPIVWLGALFSAGLHAWVFFPPRYLPYIDWANHVGLIAALTHGSDTGSLAYLDRSFIPTPYFLHYATSALFGLVMSVDQAAKVGLILATLAWTFGAAFLAEMGGRSPRLALIAPLALFGDALGYGFGSFVFALPLALFAFGAMERVLWRLDSGTRVGRRAEIVLAAVLAVAFLAHAVVFATTVILLVVRVLVFACARLRSGTKAVAAPILALSVALVPTVLLAIPTVYFVVTRPANYEAGARERPMLEFIGIDARFGTLASDLLDRGSSESRFTMAGAAVLWILWMALGFVRKTRREKPSRQTHALEIYAASFVVIYFVGPYSMNWPVEVWRIHQRFATIAALSLFLLPRAKLTGRVGALCSVLALGLVAHNAGVHGRTIRNFSAMASRYDPVRAAIPKGSRVLALTSVPRGDLASHHPAMGSLYFYHLVDGAAYVGYLFDNPLHPVRLRHDIELPRHPHWRTPDAFDPRVHGVDWDYLVLRGDGLAERARASPLHTFVRNIDGWQIFATKNPPPRPARP